MGLESRGTRVRKLINDVWKQTIQEDEAAQKGLEVETVNSEDEYLLAIEKENFAKDDNDEGIKRSSITHKFMLAASQIPVAYVNPQKPLDDIKTLQADTVYNSAVGRKHDIRQIKKHEVI